MSDLQATPAAIRSYGDSQAGTAVEVATVGATNQAAVIAAAVPVFGLIGQDFLAAFAVAQANNMLSVNEIAAVHAATAVAAHRSAAAYESTDGRSAADFGKIREIR
ncbi:type VII secretion target [Nocardia carnea]|uniref:type VII secretion target n=1 Tax=Nocardia carnea TaxID=37328 RepID=UPI002458F2A4|nr:type VII secretion target [Nocardia carnea]